MAYGDRVERDPAELRRGGRKRLAARRIGRWLGTALTGSVIVAPLIVWLTRGSVGALAVIYAAEVLLGVVARAVARSLRLPAWSASESYIGRLRRWQTDRRDPSSDPGFVALLRLPDGRDCRHGSQTEVFGTATLPARASRLALRVSPPRATLALDARRSAQRGAYAGRDPRPEAQHLGSAFAPVREHAASAGRWLRPTSNSACMRWAASSSRHMTGLERPFGKL
jgi:hypothetical protein